MEHATLADSFRFMHWTSNYRHYHEANASSHGRPKIEGRGVFVGWRAPIDTSAERFRGGQLVAAAAGNLTHTVRLADYAELSTCLSPRQPTLARHSCTADLRTGLWHVLVLF